MAEQLFKLSPHRDLQSYFYQPSAIAALSNATESGFTLSGTWRQQFDWAVVEWNRDNVFEHPALRYLPDGDLSGLTLNYVEQRANCLPIESDVYPFVEWPYLRLWAAGADGNEHVYYVRLEDHAAPVDSSGYRNASATLTLTGVPTQGKAVGVSFEGLPTTPSQPLAEQHFYCIPQSNDSLTDVAAQLAGFRRRVQGRLSRLSIPAPTCLQGKRAPTRTGSVFTDTPTQDHRLAGRSHRQSSKAAAFPPNTRCRWILDICKAQLTIPDNSLNRTFSLCRFRHRRYGRCDGPGPRTCNQARLREVNSALLFRTGP